MSLKNMTDHYKNPEEHPIRALCVWKLKNAVKRLLLCGNILISAGTDNKIRVWAINPITGKLTPEKTFKGQFGTPTRMMVYKSILFSLSARDCTLRSWDLQTLQKHKDFEGHTEHLASLCISEKDGILYTGSFDFDIRAWNVKSGKELDHSPFKGHTDSVTGVVTSGKLLISCSADKTLRIWQRKSGQNTHILHGHTNFVFGLKLYGHEVVSHSHDGTIRFWKVKGGDEKNIIDIGYPIKSINVMDKHVYTNSKNLFECYSLKGKKLFTVDGHTGHILANAWYDKKHLFTGGQDRTIRAWNLANKGKQDLLFRGHEGAVNALVIAGQFLFSGGDDCTIRLWPNPIFEKSENKGWV